MCKSGKPTPSNTPDDGDMLSMMLEKMSAREVSDALNDLLDNMTEENYDPAWIDAYLDALDRKTPMPKLPDTAASYANFQKNLPRVHKNRRIFPSFQRIWRGGLAAVFTVTCMFGCMAAAQAAGLDVFGAIARWTDDVFTFGEFHSYGAVDIPSTGSDSSEPSSDSTADLPSTSSSASEFASLQDALDAYGITEVSSPTWFPEGYTLKDVTVNCRYNGDFIGLTGEYINGTKSLLVCFDLYQDKHRMIIEKTDAPVETFAVYDTTVYLLENINNNAAAWVTEHYECFIGGAVPKSELQKMVLSAYENS